MTREEAVEVLKERYLTCVGIGLDNHANRVNEALDLAISVLSTPSGDLISRADAMAEFRECVKRANENGETPTWNDAVSLIGSLPSAKQVASKLNNPCNSLLTEESNGSKEHKSKLDLISRQDVIEALCRSSVYAWSIEQDQTAHDWALNIIKALPSAKGGDAQMNEVNPKQYMQQSPNGADLISRQDAINTLETEERNTDRAEDVSGLTLAKFLIDALPSADAEWIPCSERLPEDTAMPVLISGRHKTVGIYAVDIARYNGGMWQYDGFTFPDCEVLAWMPLPKPYREDGEEE